VTANTVDELARKLAESVPGMKGSVSTLREDLERSFRSLLDSAFERMELVTREEFDVQRKVLERTREKLAALEARLTEFERADREGTAAESPHPQSD
jgi:ubiquinone biosynthesis accessory factor UbiK